MHFERLMNALMARVETHVQSLAQPRLGTVQSYDGASHTAKVMIQPEGTLTGWLPVGTMNAGGGTVMAAPEIGAQVMVLAQEGDVEHGVIVCGIHSDALRPPQSGAAPSSAARTPLQAGEAHWVHPSGVSMRLVAGGVVVTGNLGVSGNIVCRGTISDATGSMDTLRADYNGHMHTGIRSGSSTSGPTTITDPSSAAPTDPFAA